MSNHWKHKKKKSFQGGCTSMLPMNHAWEPLLYFETFMTAAREIRAVRHHWVKLKHPSLWKEKNRAKKDLASLYHRNSFASFEAGTSLTLTNPGSQWQWVPQTCQGSREHREWNIILLFTTLYSLFFWIWDVGLASNAGFFCPVA